MASERLSLARLIAPVSTETFFKEHWEAKPLHIARKQPNYFDAVLTMEELDRVVCTYQLANPDINVVNAAREIRTSDYTYSNMIVDVARLYQLFADGATIIMNQLERFLPPLSTMCRGLERELSTRIQANVYLTPKNAQGLKTHYDSHDVLVLQIHGSKRWTIYDTPVELPFREQGFVPGETKAGAPTMEFVMHAGDSLYVPRGVMHDAASTDQDSLHITVGVLHTAWAELLLEALARVGMNDARFRKTLPVGFAGQKFDRTAAEKTFRELLRHAAETADFNEALDHFADDLVSTRQYVLEGQLAQVRQLGSMTVDTEVGVRPNLLYRIRETDTQVILSGFGGTLTLPIHAAEAVRFALETERFAVGAIPGDLDDAGKLVLVRRLMRQGLVRLLK